MKKGIIMNITTDNDTDLSRRDLLKSGAALLAAAGLPSITGCGPVKTDDRCMEKILSATNPGNAKTFESSTIGSIKLKNRIIRSAVTMNGTDASGKPKDWLLAHYEELAAGGAGLLLIRTCFSLLGV